MTDPVDTNLALARRGYERWNNGGVEALIEHVWAPDVVLYGIPEALGSGVFRGGEAVADHLRELLETVDRARFEVRWLEGRGDHVLAALELSIKGARSGAAVTTPFFHLLRFGEGRIREFRQYLDADLARSEYERLAGAPSGSVPADSTAGRKPLF